MPSGLASFAPERASEGRGSLLKQHTGVMTASMPRGFRSAEGARTARPAATGPWGAAPSPIRGSAAQKAGLRYERKVLDMLVEALPGFQRSPWFTFEDRRGPRWCQPDGLLPEPLILFEVKIRTTPLAWWQLSSLYRPVVELVFKRRVEGLVMVCRSFDPSIPMPTPVRHLLRLSVKEIIATPGETLAVYSWRP